MGDSCRIALTERDRRLVHYVSRFRLLSRDQLMALAPFGSLTRANTRLANLVRARLLSRKLVPVYPGNGSAQALYFLGRASGTVLNIGPETLNRQLRQASRWDLRQVEHVLAANQVIVDFVTGLPRAANAEPVSFQTEPELREVLGDRTFVSDGWFAWTAAGRRFNCFVEVDLHHEGLREWRAKVLRYMEYAESGVHQERFGFRAFRVCVMAKSTARLNNLRQIGETAGALFLFSQIGMVSAKNFFDPVWLRARGDTAIRLVAG
jgi:hypothetical protein